MITTVLTVAVTALVIFNAYLCARVSYLKRELKDARAEQTTTMQNHIVDTYAAADQVNAMADRMHRLSTGEPTTTTEGN